MLQGSIDEIRTCVAENFINKTIFLVVLVLLVWFKIRQVPVYSAIAPYFTTDNNFKLHIS